MLDSLRDIPIVGDVRGAGFFHAIELVKRPGDQGGVHATRSPSGFCAASSPASSTSAGSICRADDRGDPVIQLSPTLICDTEQFEEIHDVLRPVLTEAGEQLQARDDGTKPSAHDQRRRVTS